MKGSPIVIEQLQLLLNGELAARDQYFAHSRMYEYWGLTKLFDRIGHEMEDETMHADALIKRLLFLEATPDLSKPDPLRIGTDVPSMLQYDLDVEYEMVETLRKAIVICEKEEDFQTRDILLGMLDDTEEDHAHWLEQQLGLIKRIGLENYLQSQM